MPLARLFSLASAGVLLALTSNSAWAALPGHTSAVTAAASSAGQPMYFAEGTTMPGFQEYLTLENAGDQAANVNITYEFGVGQPQQQPVQLAAHSRTTVDVNLVVGADREGVSAVVDPGGNPNVFAERPMYFNVCVPVCVNGSHVAAGAQPQTSWYFAEGYTGAGFQEYITLLNPNPQSTPVMVTYSYGDGSTGSWGATLAPTSRVTVNVNQFVKSGREVAAKVESPLPIVAERPMYFNGCIAAFCMNGGSDALGAQPDTSWYFAEGFTGSGYHEYLTLFNPGDQAANITVTYMYAAGGTGVWGAQVSAHARLTVDVNQFVGDWKEVSAVVTGSSPIVVERPLYYATTVPFWQKGGSVTAGFRPAQTWNFAEGYTGPGSQEYITIANPGAASAAVSIRYLASDGSSTSQTVNVGAASRLTVDVNRVVQGGRQVATEVTGSVSIVVERPMYFTGCVGKICINIPPPPPPPVRLHKIVVSLSKQHLWAYAGGDLFVETDITTGRPELPTPAGDYHIFNKRSPFQFISPWPPGNPFWYPSAWVSYAMEFIGGGYYLHDAPWRSWYGPGSNTGDGTHGCVNIPLDSMTKLFNWASVGDEVVVQG